MTSTQAQSQFSMWAMVAAPLILGSDPRSLSSTSITMLKNSRVIAIDQDPLGAQGWPVSQTSTGQQVWVKPLAGGARAVALFNRGSGPQQITTSASAVGLPTASHYTLLNVWTNQTSTSKGKISAFVQPDAVVLYRVTADPGCTVPRLLGKTLQAARASLKTAQCSLGRVARRRVRHARRGRVIAQSPPAGSHRRRGAKVKRSPRELNGAILCGPRTRRLGREPTPLLSPSRVLALGLRFGVGRVARSARGLLLSADPQSIHVADVSGAGPAYGDRHGNNTCQSS